MEPAGENEPKPAGSAPCQPGGEGTTEPPPGHRQAVNPQEQISRRLLSVTAEKKEKKQGYRGGEVNGRCLTRPGQSAATQSQGGVREAFPKRIAARRLERCIKNGKNDPKSGFGMRAIKTQVGRCSCEEEEQAGKGKAKESLRHTQHGIFFHQPCCATWSSTEVGNDEGRREAAGFFFFFLFITCQLAPGW